MKQDNLKKFYLPERLNQLGTDIPEDWYIIELGLIRINKSEKIYLDLLETKKKYTNPSNSTIAYLLGITDVIPTNSVKTKGGTIPDIDSDFEITKRIEIFKYIQAKYGENKVAGVGTFITLKSKSAINSAGRALGFRVDYVQSISNAIPDPDQGATWKISDALEKSKDFKQLYDKDANAKKIIDIALKLENLIQSRGQHAAGAVVASDNLDSIIPSFYNDDNIRVIEVDKDDAEKLGLVKFDLLGLETLDVIKSTVKLIEKEKGIKIDIDSIDLEDPKIYEYIKTGGLSGVFQFDEPEMMNYTAKFQPKDIRDLSFLTSLNRPGPQAAKEEILHNRKAGLAKINEFPEIVESLKDTYGYMIYQEQVMNVNSILAGFNPVENEYFRKIVGKKKLELLPPVKADWLAKMKARGHDEEKSYALWNTIETFGSYGFNAAHAYAYSMLTLQCLYLKTYYYSQFLLNSLLTNTSNVEKTIFFIKEAKKFGYRFLGPDINRSVYNFRIDGMDILFGLGFVNGFSETVVKQFIKERERSKFTSFLNFYRRTRPFFRSNNYKALIMLNACSSFGYNRATLLDTFDYIEKLEEKNIISGMLFDDDDSVIYRLRQELKQKDILEAEYQYTGMYISGNIFQLIPNNILTKPRLELGMIIRIKEVKTKKKDLMAFIDILTPNDTIVNLTIFPKQYLKYSTLLESGSIIAYGSDSRNEEKPILTYLEQVTIPTTDSRSIPSIPYSPNVFNIINNSDLKKFEITFGPLSVEIHLN